jgi:hypothetical protein
MIFSIEDAGKIFLKNVTIVDSFHPTVGVSLFVANSVGETIATDINVMNTVTQNLWYLWKCFIPEGCKVTLSNSNFIGLKHSGRALFFTSVDTVIFQNISMTNYFNIDSYSLRTIFLFQDSKFLDLSQFKGIFNRSSFRAFFELLECQKVTLTNSNFKYLVSDNGFTGVVVSNRRGNMINISNIVIENFRGLSAESIIAYKNGFINIYGSDSDLVRKANTITAYTTNLTFLNCKNLPNGVLGFINVNSINIQFISFENCSANKGGGVHINWATDLNISDVKFSFSTAERGGSLYLLNIKNFAVSAVESVQSFAKTGGFAYVMNIDQGFFQNITVQNAYSTQRGGVYYADNSSVLLKNTILTHSESLEDGGVIYFYGGNLDIFSLSSFNSSSRNGGFLSAHLLMRINITDVIVKDSSASDRGTTIIIYNCENLLINKIHLHENIGLNSLGNIFLDNSGKGTYEIYKIFCFSNVAASGSCLYVNSVNDLKMENFSAYNNTGVVANFISTQNRTIFIKNYVFLANGKGKKVDGPCLIYSKRGTLNFSGIGYIIFNEASSGILFELKQIILLLSKAQIYGNSHTLFAATTTIFSITEGDLAMDLVSFVNRNISDDSEEEIPFDKNFKMNRKNILIDKPIQNLPQVSLLSIESGTLIISNSKVKSCLSSNEEACMMSLNTKVRLFNSEFSYNIGRSSGSLFSKNSSLMIEKCSFLQGSFQKKDSSLIDYLDDKVNYKAGEILSIVEPNIIATQNIRIISSEFIIFSQTRSVVIFNMQSIIIENCIFKSASIRSKGSALAIINQNCYIIDTIFSLLQSENGAAILLRSIPVDLENMVTFECINCSFSKNIAYLGGAIFIKGFVLVSVINSYFEENLASYSPNDFEKKSGIASCIYFTCLRCDKTVAHVGNTFFINNTAENFASTVFSQSELEIDKIGSYSKFINNTDGLKFSTTIASLPVKINISDFKMVIYEGEYEYNNQRMIVSGREFSFVAKLIDSQGNQLLFSNNVAGTIRRVNGSEQISNGYAISKIGQLNFSGVKVNARPNTTIFLEINIEFKEITSLPHVIENNPLNELKIILEIFVRPCIPGEIYQSGDQSCYRCPEGEFSLPDPMNTDRILVSFV